MKILQLKFGTPYLIIKRLHTSTLKLFLTGTAVMTVPIINKVIGRNQCQSKDYQQNHSNDLVCLRLLHHSAITIECGIG